MTLPRVGSPIGRLPFLIFRSFKILSVSNWMALVKGVKKTQV